MKTNKMKKLSIIFSTAAVAFLVSCGGEGNRTGSVYMPDMAYSRAYETYSDHSRLGDSGINYNSLPVNGTVARGSELPFHIPKDRTGDSTNYNASKAVVNPLPALVAGDMQEAERIYLINCGICHGAKLDGNGPLYASGKYLAKPATLVGDARYESMPDGQMFYSITYGKNLMGPYGSQLTRKERWMIIHYIRSKQGKSSTVPAAGTDSTATATTQATTTNTK
jgi:mono/diheme cytochrome c family protein